jgi:hypothetical protein
MFHNLGVVGLGAAASYQDNLGSLLNPMMVIEKLQALRHPPLRDILSGFEGVIRPGEMLRRDSSPCIGSKLTPPCFSRSWTTWFGLHNAFEDDGQPTRGISLCPR